MFCPRCGAQNADGARFCGSCGHAFPTPDRPATSPDREPEPATRLPASRSATRSHWKPRLIALGAVLAASVLLGLVIGRVGIAEAVLAPALPAPLVDFLFW